MTKTVFNFDNLVPYTEKEYLEIMKKSYSTNKIVYPDGSIGELNKAIQII